jgi:NADH:ubiquinone reductase (H+-translocating)
MQSGPHGSIRVNPDFSIAAHPHIFVIGDAAAASGMDGKPLPGLAAVAKQEGKYVGNLIRQRIAGADPTNVFRYRDYGTMATIGRSAAVADLRGVRVTGTVAWLLWGFVHIYFLIGFRNRLLVFVNWCWAWLTYARGSRLITRDEESGSTLKLRRLPKDADEPRASTLSGETGPANAKRR